MRPILRKIGKSLGFDIGAGEPGDLALVLSGGGARGAYQAGVLAYVAEAFPSFQPEIITGVSAGALNAAFLASSRLASFREAVEALVALWKSISSEQVFEADDSISGTWKLLTGKTPWDDDSDEDGEAMAAMRGVVDTSPLRAFLHEQLSVDEGGRLYGIERNLNEGRLKAVSLLTANYSTGQTMAWVQGRDIKEWDRPMRRSVSTTLTVEHVMASAALPIFFPAIRLGDTWHGDGGIRLTAPLAPALHLGADRILSLSTRHRPTREQADHVDAPGYPPLAQILGILMSAVFLDTVDHDIEELKRINGLVTHVSDPERYGFRWIDSVALRPTRDLDRLAGDFQPSASIPFRFLMRVIGSERTETPAWLSMLNFDPEYVKRVMDCGYEDAREAAADIDALLSGRRISPQV